MEIYSTLYGTTFNTFNHVQTYSVESCRHHLRHYYASTLHAIGVPDQYIMEHCGWGNDAVLKDVYRHTLGDVKEKMNGISNTYFETMQHEMQHAKESP